MNGDGSIDIVLTTEATGVGQIFFNNGDCLDGRTLVGDCNLDGSVDFADALSIIWHLFLGYGLKCHPAADVNDDSLLDLSDPIYLLEYLFKSGPPLPDTGPVGCSWMG